MRLTDEINRIRELLATYKKLIHRPSKYPPRPEEKYHQHEYEFWQARLRMLEAARRQEKLLSKQQTRLRQRKQAVGREQERRKSQ